MPDSGALTAFEAFAVELSRIAAAAILPLFRADHGLDDKGAAAGTGFDPVTLADRHAETAMRRAIADRYPDHGVIGEEFGEDRPDAEFVWVLDPIDGTRAFIAGLPLWTTLIALRRHGRPVVGAIAQPYVGEVFVGSANGARRLQGWTEHALAARPCPDIALALAATTDPYLFQGDDLEAFQRLRRAVRLVRYGCDAYAYAMVALGSLDLVIEAGLKPWDVEAAMPLIAGAGGRITDWAGAAIGDAGGRMLIAGDPGVHAQAVAVLAGVPRP